jgi:uncharacterized UBP type Zn finger protein
MTCTHFEDVIEVEPQTTQGCQECLKIDFSDWVHLRLCVSCGHVGCCDSSPHQHASAHYSETSHPVIQSFQPGESWLWCYVDEVVD